MIHFYTYLFFTDAEIPLGAGLNSDFWNKEEETSNTFSTTWSYETSGEAARAGPESDVFVVPNLNVMFEEVYVVEWDFDSCKPELDETGKDFETSVVFNVKASTSQPALSFYSRYHLNLVKIPELNDSIRAMDNTITLVQNGEDICCPTAPGSCLGDLEDGEEYRECGSDIPADPPLNGAQDLIAANKKKETLENALESWQDAIERVDNATAIAMSSGTTITNWFDNGALGEVTSDNDIKDDVEIDDGHTSKTALAPNELIHESEILSEAAYLIDAANDAQGQVVIRRTKRVQFAGDAGMFTMNLNQEAMHEFTSQNCDITAPLAVAGATGYAAFGLGGPALPIAAGAAIVGTAAAGCNYVLDLSAGVGDFYAMVSAFGGKGGIKAGFGKCQYMPY